MTVESNLKPSATSARGLGLLAFQKSFASAPGDLATSWPKYMVDAFQRSVLFLELLRQRGNEEIEITSRPMATVLRFEHEVLMSGRSLPRPINYALSRIVPSLGVVIDPRKRPVVEYFVYAMTKYAGAYAAVLGGLDAFVFTAGIGEHSAAVRAALCANLAWLGVKLDGHANDSNGPLISTADSGSPCGSSRRTRN